MRIGKEILETLIGARLQDGIIQSFVLNEKTIDNLNVLYLKFHPWIRIVTDDSVTIAKTYGEPEATKPWIENGNKIDYPLAKIEGEFTQFKKYIGLNLINYRELITSDTNIFCGIRLIFDNGYILSIYLDNDEKLFLLFGDTLPENITEREV